MKMKGEYIERFVGKTPRERGELKDRHRKVLGILQKYKFERILDIGCGDGNFSVLLKEECKAKEVYGIEISKRGVESAKKNGVKAFQFDLDEEDFPFEDKYFDAIFAGEIIEHLFDPDHFLDEVYRILKSKGIFVLSTPNLASMLNRIALLFGFQPYPTKVSLNYDLGHLFFPALGGHDHVRVMTLRGILQLLKVHGYKVTSINGAGIPIPKNFRHSGLGLVKTVDRLVTKFFPHLAYLSIIGSQKG